MGTAKRIDSAVDWLTVTAREPETAQAWKEIFQQLIEEEARVQDPKAYRKIRDYVGMGGEHWFLGGRRDGWMAQVHGPLARTYAHKLIRAGGRASRIDYQMTALCEEKPSAVLAEVWVDAAAEECKKGRCWELGYWGDRQGLRMITVGSRSSEVYGRVYDKEKESKQAEYKGCVRWEVEYKGETAHEIGRQWAAGAHAISLIGHNMRDWFRERGVRGPFDMGEKAITLEVPRIMSTPERKRLWIMSHVAPSIAIIARGLGFTVALDACFWQYLTPEEQRAIIDKGANYRGD